MTPILQVANAFNANVVHIPVIKNRITASNHKFLYGVATNKSVTIGLNFLSKSCRVNSQSNVAVVKCWICNVQIIVKVIQFYFKKTHVLHCLTKAMFDSKHFWMYSQLNSAPRAPTHNKSPRDNITSAAAHPKPAVISLLCPLPGIRDRTTVKPKRSAISTLDLRSS